MKSKVLVLGFLVIFFLQCNDGNRIGTKGDENEKDIMKFNNSLNDKYISVPGTRVSIIPPEGLEITGGIPQFNEVNGHAKLIVIESENSFYRVEELNSRYVWEHLTDKKLISYDKIKFNGYDGILIIAEETCGTIISLMFGNLYLSVAVAGSYSNQYEKEFHTVIKSSVLSTVHDSTKIFNPIEVLPFEISIEGTKLKVEAVWQCGISFSASLVENQLINDNTSFTVGYGPNEKEYSEEYWLENLFSIMQYYAEACCLAQVQPQKILINDLRGYETVGYVIADLDTVKVVYFTILFDTCWSYYLTGTADFYLEKNLELFKHITRTFKRKDKLLRSASLYR